MKVVRVLVGSHQPRCLRELVDLTGLSLAGVQDVVRRLEEKGVVKSSYVGNKRLFSPVLSKEERVLLEQALTIQTQRELSARADSYSLRREVAIDWIDQSVKVWRRGRRQIIDATSAP